MPRLAAIVAFAFALVVVAEHAFAFSFSFAFGSFSSFPFAAALRAEALRVAPLSAIVAGTLKALALALAIRVHGRRVVRLWPIRAAGPAPVVALLAGPAIVLLVRAVVLMLVLVLLLLIRTMGSEPPSIVARKVNTPAFSSS